MKKIHSFLMAAVLVASSLTSCSSSDDMESKASALTPSDKEIKFTVGDITRGTAFTGDATALGAAGYQVFAYTHESPTKYIDRVVYPGGTAYWPTTGSLDFLALYPKTLTASQVNPTAWNVFSYTAPTAIDDQVDLMAATATDKSSGTVDLAFSHLLSQISIKAKAATNLTVIVKSVALHNVKTTGTFDGTELSAGSEINNYAIDFTEQTLAADGAVADLTGSNVLLLVPQITTAWPTSANNAVSITYNDGESGAKGSYIKVELKVKNGDSFVLGAADSYATVYFPLAINWIAQKHYTYTLTFGDSDSPTDGFGYNGEIGDTDTEGSGNPEDAEPTGVTQIGYTVTVSDWEDEDPTPVIF